MGKAYWGNPLLLLVMLFFVQLTYGQLSNFTLTVTPTNETCTANGTLSLAVSNTTAGSTIVYAIYKLPNTTTPLAVVSGNLYTGLVSGNYLVVATQSLGSQSGVQQQQVSIINQRVLLTYQVSGVDAVCGNDGQITVTTVTGTASTYEIILGPVTRPPQTSNVFNNLPGGQYTIRVIDNCNEGVVQTFTLRAKNPALVFTNVSASLAGCNTVRLGFTFATSVPNPIGVVVFPLQVVTTVTPSSGSPVVYNNSVTSGNSFSIVTPLFTPQPYNYSFVITDGCGVVYTINGVVNNLDNTTVSATTIPVNCTTKKIKFSPVTGLVLVAAPAGYPTALPQDFTSQIIGNQYTTGPLGVGIYTFQATNLCGQVQTLTIEIQQEPSSTPYAYAYNLSCNSGSLAFNNITQIVLVAAPATYTGALPYDFSNTINAFNTAVLVNLPLGIYTANVLDMCGVPKVITVTITVSTAAPGYTVFPDCSNTNMNTLRVQGDIASIVLTAAPAAYGGGALPQNFTSQLVQNSLVMVGLPLGNYSYTITNSCGNTIILPVTILPQQETTIVNAIQNCGSFNVELHHTSNNTAPSTFWLQKYYPVGNDWGSPSTGILQGSNMPGSSNALAVVNNIINLNYAYAGQFRLVKVQPIFVLGSSIPSYCFKVLNEFQTVGLPEITGVNSVSCNNNLDVLVNATGFGPLTYKITTKDGLPFVINNGTSNLFTNLAVGVYTFQVIDFCGNIVNSVYEINVQSPLVITANNVCPNQAASLSVPSYSFLTYQWWKNTNPSVILSTTNILSFASFNAATQGGTYTVSIIYAGNPSSCLNATLTYTIDTSDFFPNAGNSNAVSYCGGQGIIDLFTLLIGAHDTDGVWEVVSNNTTVTGSNWNSNNAAVALYQFKYTVTAAGSCSISDDALVTVNIKEVPDTPIATVDPIQCDGQNIALFASPVPNVSYQWTGPNSFTSSNQNPIIGNATSADNGDYTVKVVKNGCPSESDTIAVLLHPNPQFTLESKCDGNRFTITAIPTNASFDVNEVSYAWAGPNGYASSVNPIDITQLPIGDYALTVTNDNGCTNTVVAPVTFTFCEIPNVITPNNDQRNDSFDLSGLGVQKIEIYNRWGVKVYEKEGYLNEWHGQNMHGNQLPDSTYYYCLRFKDKEDKVGWVFVNGG